MEVSRLVFVALNHAIADCLISSPNRMAKLQGGQECTLTATALLTSTTTRQVWARPPIDVDFQVLMFTASGLIVRFLKVFEKSNYTSIKWVRYLTKASGSYQVRVSFSFLVWCSGLEADCDLRFFQLVLIQHWTCGVGTLDLLLIEIG